MLIVISDLHFVDGTAGDHNLPCDAFKSFLSDIASLAKDHIFIAGNRINIKMNVR